MVHFGKGKTVFVSNLLEETNGSRLVKKMEIEHAVFYADAVEELKFRSFLMVQ